MQIKEVTMKSEHDKNVWILIGIVSIIEFVGKSVFNYVDYKLLNLKNASNIQFQVRIFQIIFASAFSSCILHTKFPIHHIFSMIIVWIGWLLVNVTNIFTSPKSDRFLYVVTMLITLMFFGFQEVLHKK